MLSQLAHISRSSKLHFALESKLEYKARQTKEELPRKALLSEAERLFEAGIKEDPSNPYGYLGKVSMLKQERERERDADQRVLIEASILSLLEEAYESTGLSPLIAGELAQQKDEMGSTHEAIKFLQAGLRKKPDDIRLRDLLIRYQIDQGLVDQALSNAIEGTKLNPTAWRIQRHIARLKRKLGHDVQSVRGHYEAALRHNKGDLPLTIELGAYLFTNGMYSEAKAIFVDAANLPATGPEKTQIREKWQDETGRSIRFKGKVKSLHRAGGFVTAIPENFEAFFWRTKQWLTELVEGSDVEFFVGFNARGAFATILKPS